MRINDEQVIASVADAAQELNIEHVLSDPSYCKGVEEALRWVVDGRTTDELHSIIHYAAWMRRRAEASFARLVREGYCAP